MGYLRNAFLESFSILGMPCNECQPKDGHSIEVVELAHIFKSLSMFTFGVLVFSFHFELFGININHYDIANRIGLHASWPLLLQHMSTMTHLIHLFLGISVYLSLYYLYIPFLALFTFYNGLPLYFRNDVFPNINLIRIVNPFLIFLWIYAFVWTTVTSDVLEVYYSEINTAYNLLKCSLQLVGLFILFYISGLLLRFCILKERAVTHFQGQIAYLDHLLQNFYIP